MKSQKDNSKQNKFFLFMVLIIAVLGTYIIVTSSAAIPSKFITRSDVGPQASTYGHTPAGTLQKWTKGSTINDSSAPRDPDGWMRIKGYEFDGPLLINTSNVEISDCKVTLKTNGSILPGAVYTRTSNIPSDFTIDHCHIDQGPTGWSTAGILGYGKFTVRYSLITGSGDGIKIGRNALAEHNYIEVNGQGTETAPGHIDGIHGEYFKFDWTARHNTIIGGIGQAPSGGSYREERGGNIGIWIPDTPSGSAGYSGAEGVLAEDNYIDGFNTGIGIMGTNPDNPSIARNNAFGANFRYYPGLWVRTSDYGRTGSAPGPTNYVIVEGNVGNLTYNPNTGTVSPYGNGPTAVPDFFNANGYPDPDPDPQTCEDPSAINQGQPLPCQYTDPDPPPPDPDPDPPVDPGPSDLPIEYSFDQNTVGWVEQGNAKITHETNEGNLSPGALTITSDQSAPYPDSSKTLRVGTTQYISGLKVSAGETVNAKFDVKSASVARNVRCELRFYNGYTILSTFEGVLKGASNNWSERSCSTTAPTGTTNVGLRVFIEGSEYGETFYIDDAVVSSEEISVDPPSSKQCDFDGDNKIGLQDLARLLSNYDKNVTVNTDGDCDGDGRVSLSDLAKLLSLYD